MPLVRAIISARENVSAPSRDSFVNTIYFNVSGSVDEPAYQDLADDIWDAWGQGPWQTGRYLDVRLYNMDDPEPRPVKAFKRAQVAGTMIAFAVPQVALALSYYADRNLPRQRGRIFISPWSTGAPRPTTAQQNDLLALATRLADIGGLNVDWSLYSPTTGDHTRISTAWVDNAWDVIRSRRLQGTSRVTVNING